MADYLYDVAFSFLGKDEPIARRLNDLLAGRLRTFIYSDADRQAQIAAGDGAEKFGRVFGVESASVVILYREGWGTAGFTAVEADAIRNRAYEFGYEFVTMVPLDSPPAAPVWFPRHRLWVGQERWGWDSVAAVIERHAIEAGGTIREQSVEDAAKQAKAVIEAEQARASFLSSHEGVGAAREAFAQLRVDLEAAARQSMGLVGYEADRGLLRLTTSRHLVSFALDIEYSNTLRDSKLRVWQETFSDRRFATDPTRATAYEFDRHREAFGWREKGRRDRPLLTSKELADQETKALLRVLAADALRLNP